MAVAVDARSKQAQDADFKKAMEAKDVLDKYNDMERSAKIRCKKLWKATGSFDFAQNFKNRSVSKVTKQKELVGEKSH